MALGMGLDHPVDLIQRAVAAMAFNEENLKVRTETGKAVHRRLDIVAFVAAGDQHRGGRPLRCRFAARPRDHIVAEAEPSQQGRGAAKRLMIVPTPSVRIGVRVRHSRLMGSKSASCRRAMMSSVESQFWSTCGIFRPSFSATRKRGSQACE